MLIDKATKEMLFLMQTSTPDHPRKCFSYDHICELAAMDEDDMFPILKGLVASGLAEYCYYETGSDKVDMGAALTQKGIAYKELQRLETRERWKERAIGFVSGVILATIPWLLGLLR